MSQVRSPAGKSGLSENSNTKSRNPLAGATNTAPVFTSFAAARGTGLGSLAIAQAAVPFCVTTMTDRVSAGASAASASSKVSSVPVPSTIVSLTTAPGPVTTTPAPSKPDPVTAMDVVVPGTTR